MGACLARDLALPCQMVLPSLSATPMAREVAYTVPGVSGHPPVLKDVRRAPACYVDHEFLLWVAHWGVFPDSLCQLEEQCAITLRFQVAVLKLPLPNGYNEVTRWPRQYIRHGIHDPGYIGVLIYAGRVGSHVYNFATEESDLISSRV